MTRLALLSLCVWLLACASAFGFVVEQSKSGSMLHWDRSAIPVGWRLNEGGAPGIGEDATRQTLQASFQTWADVPCSYLDFEYKGRVNVSPENVGTMDYDRLNVMVWINQEDWPGEWVDAFAVTVPLFEEQNGRLVDVDILFNRKFTWSIAREGEAGKADLQSIATHEIGHLFGLDHPPVSDATMYWSAVEGEVHKRTLAADDIQGICHIYPVAGRTGSPCSGDAVCQEDRACVEHAASGGAICSDACVCPSDCPPAFTCIEEHCLPPNPEIGFFGSPCASTRPCGEGDLICVSNICSIYCTRVSDCPDGWDCLKLVGHSGSACYTSDPDLLPQDKPDQKATIVTFTAGPAGVLPRTTVTLRCEAESEGELRYRFAVRPVGETDWETLKDFSTTSVSYWTPNDPGVYDLRAEVLVVGEDACPEDERLLTYTVERPDGEPADGDVPDGDAEPSTQRGGCRHASPSLLIGLFLLALAARTRRRAC